MFDGTTILCVRKGGKVVMAGDGQVSMGNTVLKHGAVKVRTIGEHGVIAGFAGSTADAFTLYERFEKKLKEYNSNITRAAVELAKDWRMDKYLRRLEALLLIANKEKTFLLTGTGDVVEPDEGVSAIGSGGNYAYAAALALAQNTDLDPREIAEKALKIASTICVFTNSNIHFEEIEE